jgi:hypothetical protein
MHDHDHDVEQPPVRSRAGDAGHGSPATPVVAHLQALQRAAGNAGVTNLIGSRADDDEPLSPVHRVLAAGGEPLDATTRHEMEGRLGHGFGDVRIHTGDEAAASARSVQARAYTSGSHIVFGADAFAPGTSEGQRTLAHELAHVVQQRRGPVDGTDAPGGIRLSDPGDRFEQEAERVAASVQRDDVDDDEFGEPPEEEFI